MMKLLLDFCGGVLVAVTGRCIETRFEVPDLGVLPMLD
jgi:hypothetical protein